MNTHYPHHHSDLHSTARARRCGRFASIACTCWVRLEVPLSASTRRAIEDNHECVEKVTARQPQVALPFN